MFVRKTYFLLLQPHICFLAFFCSLSKKKWEREPRVWPTVEKLSLNKICSMAAHTITQEPRQHRSQISSTTTDNTGNNLEEGSSDNRLGGGNSQRPASWKTFGSPAQLHFKSEETVKKFFRQTILPNHIFKFSFLSNNVPTLLKLKPYFS